MFRDEQRHSGDGVVFIGPSITQKKSHLVPSAVSEIPSWRTVTEDRSIQDAASSQSHNQRPIKQMSWAVGQVLAKLEGSLACSIALAICCLGGFEK